MHCERRYCKTIGMSAMDVPSAFRSVVGDRDIAITNGGGDRRRTLAWKLPHQSCGLPRRPNTDHILGLVCVRRGLKNLQRDFFATTVPRCKYSVGR
jgi:hypothetical protein